MRSIFAVALIATFLAAIYVQDVSATRQHQIRDRASFADNIKQRKVLYKRRLNQQPKSLLDKRQNPVYNSLASPTGTTPQQQQQAGSGQPGQPQPCPDPKNPNCPQQPQPAQAQAIALPAIFPNLVVPPAPTLPGLSLPATPTQLVSVPAVPGLPGAPTLPGLPGLPAPPTLPSVPDLSTVTAPPAEDED